MLYIISYKKFIQQLINIENSIIIPICTVIFIDICSSNFDKNGYLFKRK